MLPHRQLHLLRDGGRVMYLPWYIKICCRRSGVEHPNFFLVYRVKVKRRMFYSFYKKFLRFKISEFNFERFLSVCTYILQFSLEKYGNWFKDFLWCCRGIIKFEIADKCLFHVKIVTFLQNGSNMPSPLGAKVARNPPIFFIDYDVFQLVLQHIQKRKNLGGLPWNDWTSLMT